MSAVGYFPSKIDLGSIACTPLIWSASCVTRKSTPKEYKIYASSRDKCILGNQKLDHLARRHASCLIQVGIQSRGDEMRRRLRPGPVDRLALAHKNLNGTP